jgi:S-adenosylmethionine decarboxylase
MAATPPSPACAPAALDLAAPASPCCPGVASALAPSFALVEPLPRAGQEWLVDAFGCEPERLRNLDRLRGLVDEVVRELALRPVAPALWHAFPGEGGVTGAVLLAESHLTLHSFPEHGTLTMNLYCCRARPAFPFELRLPALLGAKRVDVRLVTRGGA